MTDRELCGVLVLFFLSHGGANSFNDFFGAG
jgi:hypothetical protein